MPSCAGAAFTGGSGGTSHSCACAYSALHEQKSTKITAAHLLLNFPEAVLRLGFFIAAPVYCPVGLRDGTVLVRSLSNHDATSAIRAPCLVTHRRYVECWLLQETYAAAGALRASSPAPLFQRLPKADALSLQTPPDRQKPRCNRFWDPISGLPEPACRRLR